MTNFVDAVIGEGGGEFVGDNIFNEFYFLNNLAW